MENEEPDSVAYIYKDVYYQQSCCGKDFMAEKVIYIMRHGQTVWNREHRIQGRKDSALLPESLLAVQRAAEYLAGQGIDKVFSSPLPRASCTADIVCGILGLPNMNTPLLLECDHGRCEGMIREQVDVQMPEFYRARRTDKWATPWPDGEAYEDVYRRAEQFAAAELEVGQKYLVIAHEMVNKCLVGALLQWQHDRIMDFKQTNTELLVIHGSDLMIHRF